MPVPCYGHLKFLMKIKTIFKASCKTIKTCYDKVQQIQMEKQQTGQLDGTCTHNLTLTCSKCTCYYSSSSSDPSCWKHIRSNKVASHHIYFHWMPKKATMKKLASCTHAKRLSIHLQVVIKWLVFAQNSLKFKEKYIGRKYIFPLALYFGCLMWVIIIFFSNEWIIIIASGIITNPKKITTRQGKVVLKISNWP